MRRPARCTISSPTGRDLSNTAKSSDRVVSDVRVKFLQTADPQKYARVLEASAPSTRAFCALHGHEYETYVGVKRGRRPWHATFNRIDLLQEALDAGFDGWIVYLDADSFVVDLKFDLQAYLQQHPDAPLIARANPRESADMERQCWRFDPQHEASGNGSADQNLEALVRFLLRGRSVAAAASPRPS